MEGKERRIILGVVTVLLIGIPVSLWYFDQGVAAILWGVGLVSIVTFAVATWWTRQTMAMGSELMLRAQESDDRRDSILIREIGNLARVLMKQAQSDAFPLPDQAGRGRWLPRPAEMEDILDIEIDELRD